MSLETSWYLAAAAILFILGAYCIAVKRNMIKIVIGVEILTSAVHLNFVALGSELSPTLAVEALAQSVVIVSIVIAAAIATLALLLVINAHRHYATLDVRRLRRLRW
ncbi:NADH-quinone oxidoreductase subunit K [Candidatus Hecatella orcuttiae]|jgi:multicomponent Na+:H+ antiporter subunit C|uniref:NADH-quinone oxidoreductase subunit K n=1 Tax=Candidatus Hecatella orcuttiae TaxID=1935119 RepID=UPI002868179E|nr:NADH-quinone oxidoreductase subunit K [Candidatus Hecatella orcuttiae]